MPPNTPQNLDELVQATQKIPIFAMARSLIVNQAGIQSYSSLLKEVIPDLKADERLPTQKQGMFNHLSKIIRFSSDPPFYIAWDLSNSGFLRTQNRTRVFLRKTTIFGVVDNFFILNQFRQSLALFGKYKPAKGHSSMSFYTSREVWFVQRNFFMEIFATGLTSLVESGIYERWHDNYVRGRYQLAAYARFREIKKGVNNSIKTDAYATDGQPATLEQVGVPLALYLGMVLGSMMVFMYESKLRVKVLMSVITKYLLNFFNYLLNKSVRA